MPTDELAVLPIDRPLAIWAGRSLGLMPALFGVSSQRAWNESQRRQAASTAPNQMAIPTQISPSSTAPSITPSFRRPIQPVREADVRWSDRMGALAPFAVEQILDIDPELVQEIAVFESVDLFRKAQLGLSSGPDVAFLLQ
jgi:hypothetical protein